MLCRADDPTVKRLDVNSIVIISYNKEIFYISNITSFYSHFHQEQTNIKLDKIFQNMFFEYNLVFF